jgi:SAM-dependent methyltransferase
MDLRYGGYTGGVRESRFSHLGANETASTRYVTLPHLLGPYLRTGDVLVDVGCGRGRVLNWVLHDGRAAVIYGIEIDPDIANSVRHRLRRHAKVRVLTGDALLLLPDEATIFYVWHSFGKEIMVKFRDAVIRKYGDKGTLRNVRIIYHNAQYAEVWTDDARCRVTEIPLPADERHRGILIEFA